MNKIFIITGLIIIASCTEKNANKHYYNEVTSFYDSLVKVEYSYYENEEQKFNDNFLPQNIFVKKGDSIMITYYDVDKKSIHSIQHKRKGKNVEEQIYFYENGVVSKYEFYNWSGDLVYFVTFTKNGKQILQKGTTYIMAATDIYERKFLDRDKPFSVHVFVASPPNIKNNVKMWYQKEANVFHEFKIVPIIRNRGEYRFMPDDSGQYYVVINVESFDDVTNRLLTKEYDTVKFEITTKR